MTTLSTAIKIWCRYWYYIRATGVCRAADGCYSRKEIMICLVCLKAVCRTHAIDKLHRYLPNGVLFQNRNCKLCTVKSTNNTNSILQTMIWIYNQLIEFKLTVLYLMVLNIYDSVGLILNCQEFAIQCAVLLMRAKK